MTGLSTRVTMIVDLVGSRRHADRVWVHRAFTDALAAVNRSVPAEQPLEPTVGDEAQARYATVEQALRSSLLLRLELPEQLDARTGIGGRIAFAIIVHIGAIRSDGTVVFGILGECRCGKG